MMPRKSCKQFGPLFVESTLLLCVLLGLGWTVLRFIIDGKLPQPFIFDINDTFMDWFNTSYWAHNLGSFSVWRTVYPPLSFVFLSMFGSDGCYSTSGFDARNCDFTSIVAIFTAYFIGATLAWIAFRKRDRFSGNIRGAAFAFGLPLLFTLERGNLILVGFIFFVLAYGDIIKSRIFRAFSIAVTINFKPYLVITTFAYAIKRDWRRLELAAILTVILYFLTYSILGEGSPLELQRNISNWVIFTNGAIWEQVFYTTSYVPFLEFNTHRFPTRDFLGSQAVETIFTVIPIAINCSRLLIIFTLIGVWLQPRALSTLRVMTIFLAGSLMNQSPGGYAMVFLVFLVFLERFERPGPIIAIVSAYLLCIPADYVLSNVIELNGDAWLSGRSVMSSFGPSVGMFVRPGLIIMILWALAFDSLMLIWRENRRSHPNFALSPAQLGSKNAAG